MRIELCGVSKRFGDVVVALAGVTTELASGRRVALVGPNGSGKSTLNRALLGLVRCEGEVRLDGVSPGAERMDTARRIAYVPQAAPQLAAPVGELVAALSRVRDLDPGAVAKLAADLELDLSAVADRPFRGLSGGMKQKLLIALALSTGASLLVLDEPTGSLDARSRARFFSLLDEHAGGATVVLCSHRLEEVRQLVDHAWVLQEGRLVQDGPAEAFLDAAATALLEVCAAGDTAARWLGEHGFRRARGGWWLRGVDRREKRELLAALFAACPDAVQDVNVRDVETLALGDGEGGDG